jgi:hypothetical protein
MKIKEFIKKNIIPIAIILIVGTSVIVATSLAYFTSSTERVLNVFTSGGIKISVIEDNFDKDRADTVNPNEVVSKDPYVKNIGQNPVYVFMQVEVPRREVTLVGDDRVTLEEDFVPIFTYDINSSWILVDSTAQSESDIYMYAYIGGILNPNEQSSTLFDEVKIVNYLEGTLDLEEKLQLIIKGYAVQSDNLKIEGTTASEKMTYIYNNYVK